LTEALRLIDAYRRAANYVVESCGVVVGEYFIVLLRGRRPPKPGFAGRLVAQTARTGKWAAGRAPVRKSAEQ
jgi:hypothetical protein